MFTNPSILGSNTDAVEMRRKSIYNAIQEQIFGGKVVSIPGSEEQAALRFNVELELSSEQGSLISRKIIQLDTSEGMSYSIMVIKKELDNIKCIIKDSYLQIQYFMSLGQLAGCEEEGVAIMLSPVMDEMMYYEDSINAFNVVGQPDGWEEKQSEIWKSIAVNHKVELWARIAAAKTLSKLPGHEENQAKAWKSIATDLNLEVNARIEAANSLGQIAGHGEEAITILITFTEMKSYECPIDEVVKVLAMVDEAEEKRVDALLLIATNPDIESWVRNNAAFAIKRLGGYIEKQIKAWASLAKDKTAEGWVRHNAINVLRVQRQEISLLVLLSIAINQNMDVASRLDAVEVLDHLAKLENEIIAVLYTIITTPDIRLSERFRVAETLSQFVIHQKNYAKSWEAIASDDSEKDRVLIDAAKVVGPLSSLMEMLIGIWQSVGRDQDAAGWGRFSKVQTFINQHQDRLENELKPFMEDPNIVESVQSEIIQKLLSTDRLLGMELLITITAQLNIGADSNIQLREAWSQLAFKEEKCAEAWLLIAMNENEESWGRYYAAKNLSQLNIQEEKCAQAWMSIAMDENVEDWLRIKAARFLLSKHEEEGIAILLSIVRDPVVNVSTRVDAVGVLVHLAKHKEECVAILLSTAKDEEVEHFTRIEAVKVLSLQEDYKAEAIQAWSSIVYDIDIDISNRIEIIKTLGRLVGPENEAKALLFIMFDEDEDSQYRAEAAEKLIQVEGYKEKASAALKLMVTRGYESDSVRVYAASVLLDDNEALDDDIINAISHIADNQENSESLRLDASQLLTQIPKCREEAAIILKSIAFTEDPQVTHLVKAAEALVQIPDYQEEVAQVLLTFMNNQDGDSFNQFQVARFLVQVANYQEEAAQVLLAIINNGDEESFIRIKATEALTHAPEYRGEGMMILLNIANNQEEEGFVRAQAAAALVEIAEYKEEATSILHSIAVDENIKGIELANAVEIFEELLDDKQVVTRLMRSISESITEESYHKYIYDKLMEFGDGAPWGIESFTNSIPGWLDVENLESPEFDAHELSYLSE